MTLTFRVALLAFSLVANGADVRPLDDELPKVLWRAPHPMVASDWVCGPGGCDPIPVAPFQFMSAMRMGGCGASNSAPR